MNTSDRTLDALLVVAVQDLVDADIETARTTDTSDTKVSKKAQRRVRRTIRRYAQDSRWAEIPYGIRRTVASVLVACTVFLGVCLSIPEVRAELVDTALRWYDKFVSVFFVADTDVPEYIEEYKEPMLQIAGTEKQVVRQSDTLLRIAYLKEDDPIVLYRQSVIHNEPLKIDSEDSCVQSTVNINGREAKLFSYSTGVRIITWHDNQYMFSLECYSEDIDSKMLITIAESLR